MLCIYYLNNASTWKLHCMLWEAEYVVRFLSVLSQCNNECSVHCEAHQFPGSSKKPWYCWCNVMRSSTNVSSTCEWVGLIGFFVADILCVQVLVTRGSVFHCRAVITLSCEHMIRKTHEHYCQIGWQLQETCADYLVSMGTLWMYTQ